MKLYLQTVSVGWIWPVGLSLLTTTSGAHEFLVVWVSQSGAFAQTSGKIWILQNDYTKDVKFQGSETNSI